MNIRMTPEDAKRILNYIYKLDDEKPCKEENKQSHIHLEFFLNKIKLTIM